MKKLFFAFVMLASFSGIATQTEQAAPYNEQKAPIHNESAHKVRLALQEQANQYPERHELLEKTIHYLENSISTITPEDLQQLINNGASPHETLAPTAENLDCNDGEGTFSVTSLNKAVELYQAFLKQKLQDCLQEKSDCSIYENALKRYGQALMLFDAKNN